jgi:hypothetical protein
MRPLVRTIAGLFGVWLLTVAYVGPASEIRPTLTWPIVGAARDVAPGVSAERTGAAPELPRLTVDTSEVKVAGRTVHVSAGEDLQAAINQAVPGDAILLDPRQTYRGPFELPKKDGDGWILIASAAGGGLPASGHRVSPSHASLMPKLVSSSDTVVAADAGAHHYRFVGIEIAPADGRFLYSLVQLGDDETSVDKLPHHIIFDRCYLHGDPKKGSRRAIAMNSRYTAVVDSYLSDFKEVGADSQAIAAWNGPGPFKISNNYLEAAGENVMFGGGDPSITGLVPSDIEVTRNHMAKPLRWRVGDPEFEGTAWAVKNLFELKNARRILVDGNLFENNWVHAQNGFAVLFTPRNQKGGAPWSVVEDVTFSNNVVRHVGAGMNILGRDDNYTSQQTCRIVIRNNLFEDVGGRWGGNGRLFQLLDGTSAVVIDHNTASQTGGIVFGGDHASHAGFVFQNNVMPDNHAGIVGSDTAVGKQAIERYFPGAVIRRNAFVGANAADYPPDNFFPPSIEAVRRYAEQATDGRDPGADLRSIPVNRTENE